MVWRLQFDGSATSVITPYTIARAASATIEFHAVSPSPGGGRILQGNSPVEGSLDILLLSAQTLRARTWGTFATTLNLVTNNVPFRASVTWEGTDDTPVRLELDAQSVIKTKGANAGAGDLAIGILASGAGVTPWLGSIWDVRVYDGDFGALLHHWPINDNALDGGTILDVVGGLDGTLTLGTGSWVWVPTEFGITRPVARSINRPVRRLGIAGPGI